MKETDDMSLFVFFCAPNQVNTKMPMTPRALGTRLRQADSKDREQGSRKSVPPTTQVFAHHYSKQTPKVKRNKGVDGKRMPRKTERTSPVCSAFKTVLLLWR